MPDNSSASCLMPAPEAQLQVAHILFMDMVGYSRLQIDLKKSYTEELQEIVGTTLDFKRAAERSTLICRPTGDGMALIFLDDMLAPLRCAVEIATTLQARPRIKVRMGIHSGPIYIVTDINGSRDVQGDGIVMAQRVMDCGDEGHILLSASLAALLNTVKPWSLYLTDLGLCHIKHGQMISLYNLVSPREFGTTRIPRKIVTVRTEKTTPTPPLLTHYDRGEPSSRALTYFLLFLLLLGASAGTGWLVSPAFRDTCRITFSLSGSAEPPKFVPESVPQAKGETSIQSALSILSNGTASLPRRTSLVNPKPHRQPPPLKSPHIEILPDDDTSHEDTSPSEPADSPAADAEVVWHNFKALVRIPRDGHGNRFLYVTYCFGSKVKEDEKRTVGEGDQIDLDCEYKGKNLKVQVKCDDNPVREYNFPVPSDEVQYIDL